MSYFSRKTAVQKKNQKAVYIFTVRLNIQTVKNLLFPQACLICLVCSFVCLMSVDAVLTRTEGLTAVLSAFPCYVPYANTVE